MPVQQAFENGRKFTRDSPKARAINDKITEFMAFDDQPFSVVEDQEFQQLITHLEPWCTLPNHRFFADACLPALYDLVATHIYWLIDSKISDVSFTMDTWTSDDGPVQWVYLVWWLRGWMRTLTWKGHAIACTGVLWVTNSDRNLQSFWNHVIVVEHCKKEGACYALGQLPVWPRLWRKAGL